MHNLQSYIETLIAVLIVFFAPITGMIILVALSTLIDTGFGIWKVQKLDEKISSKKFRFGLVPKLISYVIAVMLVYASDYFILNELTKILVSVEFLSTKVIALTLISIEVKSMDESFEAVRGWSFLKKFTGLIMKAKNIKKQIEE
tara:strand:+ start:204 stop:638 length:435 start_codon:yes stop_codon:yes gene_type:complete